MQCRSEKKCSDSLATKCPFMICMINKSGMIRAVRIHHRKNWSFTSRELILTRIPSRAKIVRLIQITNHTDFAVLNRREQK